VWLLARNRQAVRRFADRPVPDDLLARMVDCSLWSPSAAEDQPWRFVVVKDALRRHRLAEAAFNSVLVRTAAAVIAGCARIHSRVRGSGHPSHPLDLAAATQTMALAAADLGVQAVWIPGFRESSVRQILDIPADVPVVTLLAVGYADGFAPLPERRPHEETVSWDGWTGGGAA
jgi:nitroreductase